MDHEREVRAEKTGEEGTQPSSPAAFTAPRLSPCTLSLSFFALPLPSQASLAPSLHLFFRASFLWSSEASLSRHLFSLPPSPRPLIGPCWT